MHVMKKVHVLVVACVVVALGGILAANRSDAFSLREFLGLERETATEKEDPSVAQRDKSSEQNWAKPAAGGTAPTLQLNDIQNIVANLDDAQRKALLADAETFKRVVQQEADNLSVLAAARANNLHQDPNVQFLMQRGADNILRENYLNRLIAGRVPADFPTEEQIREYFDKNKERFVLDERVHVWQIFLPVNKDMDDKAVAAVQRRAEDLKKELDAGKTDFAKAAQAHSTHEPSRHNGGYMGLVRVSELKPEVREPLLALEEGKISRPLRTDTGVHILRRGSRVPAQQVKLDEVRQQIRQLLQNQARTQLRQAIFDQARKSYPVDVQESRVEEWRLRLRTADQAASSGGM
jgi:parvulin-like peptidyl-prolyl isomerase